MSPTDLRLGAFVEEVPTEECEACDVFVDGVVVARFGVAPGCAPRREVGLVIRPNAAQAANGPMLSTLLPRRLAAMLKAAVESELEHHRGGSGERREP